MKRTHGAVSLVSVLLFILLFHLSRVVLPFWGEPPAFDVNRAGYVTIYLGEGFPETGYHHFIDGSTVDSVIQVTYAENPGKTPVFKGAGTLLCTGEALKVIYSDAQTPEIKRYFVPAGQRISLGIALHPDTMKVSDWQALPGIGPKLAKRIVKDRQKNGDFGEIEAVQRVTGIGSATIKRLKKFF